MTASAWKEGRQEGRKGGRKEGDKVCCERDNEGDLFVRYCWSGDGRDGNGDLSLYLPVLLLYTPASSMFLILILVLKHGEFGDDKGF